MTLHLNYCARAGDNPARVSPTEFLSALPRVAHPLHWFADFSGANIRTVERWVDGSQDIPFWVMTLLRLRARLEEGIAWSLDHRPWSDGELAWQSEASIALWVTRARKSRQVIHHIDGDPNNSDVTNLRVVDISENSRG